MSLFKQVGCTKGSVQFWGVFERFITWYCLQWRVVSTLPNSQAGGPPLVGYPHLLIQYIRSNPPHWRPFIHNLRMHHAMVTRTHLSQPYSTLLLFFNSRLLLDGCLLVSPDLDKRSKRFTSALHERWVEGPLVWTCVPYYYNTCCMCLIIILILSFNFNFKFTFKGNS